MLNWNQVIWLQYPFHHNYRWMFALQCNFHKFASECEDRSRWTCNFLLRLVEIVSIHFLHSKGIQIKEFWKNLTDEFHWLELTFDKTVQWIQHTVKHAFHTEYLVFQSYTDRMQKKPRVPKWAQKIPPKRKMLSSDHFLILLLVLVVVAPFSRIDDCTEMRKFIISYCITGGIRSLTLIMNMSE